MLALPIPTTPNWFQCNGLQWSRVHVKWDQDPHKDQRGPRSVGTGLAGGGGCVCVIIKANYFFYYFYTIPGSF